MSFTYFIHRALPTVTNSVHYRNKICFGCCSGLFRETKIKKISVGFGISTLYRNNPKFSEKYSNMFSIKLFGLVFWNSLVRYRSETTGTNWSKKPWKTQNFLEKYKNMLLIKLFRMVFCLFRSNRNIETLCFGIEAKQPRQTVSKQTKTTKKPEKP